MKVSDLTLIFVDMSLYTIEIKYGTNQVSRVEFCSWVIYTENFKYQISNPYEDIVITRNCFEIDHTFCRLISTNKCLSSKFQVSTPHNSEDTSITRIFFSGTYRRTDGSEKKVICIQFSLKVNLFTKFQAFGSYRSEDIALTRNCFVSMYWKTDV